LQKTEEARKFSKKDITVTYIKGDGSEGNRKVFKTAQLLKTTKKKDGTIVNTVAITSFTYDESKYASEWDSTLGNKQYSTIYVDDWFDPRGIKYWDLQHISRGWILDTNVSVSGTIKAGQAGATFGGYGYAQNKTWTVSGTTFDMDVPASWTPVTSEGGGAGILQTIVGCSTQVTYKRGT
jgi:hypothetical protein